MAKTRQKLYGAGAARLAPRLPAAVYQRTSALFLPWELSVTSAAMLRFADQQPLPTTMVGKQEGPLFYQIGRAHV